jgi:aspartate carbamoyltransferase
MSSELSFDEYESRLSRPVRVKVPDFQTGERLRHVIFSAQFTTPLLDRLGRVADRIRLLANSNDGQRFLINLLPHKRAMLYFTQPSTRTFLSFAAACQILGMSCNEVRDPSVSSEAKGESPFDSIRMFSSYFDVIIMRSAIPRFAECCAYMMNDLATTQHHDIPIVNAGAGSDEHPTQALLDIYTLQRAFKFENMRDSNKWKLFDELRTQYPGLRRGIDGKTIGFCGDIRRGRTARSLVQLLTLYEDVRLIFIAPNHPTLALPGDLKDKLLARGVNIREVNSFEDDVDGRPAIEQFDCLYMTRVQREHNSSVDENEFREIDFSKFCLNKSLVARMKRYAAILHPFPRDAAFGEIPPEIDSDERAHYFRQARNGMWVRAALLAHVFDIDGAINDYYSDYTRDMQIAPS